MLLFDTTLGYHSWMLHLNTTLQCFEHSPNHALRHAICEIQVLPGVAFLKKEREKVWKSTRRASSAGMHSERDKTTQRKRKRSRNHLTSFSNSIIHTLCEQKEVYFLQASFSRWGKVELTWQLSPYPYEKEFDWNKRILHSLISLSQEATGRSYLEACTISVA